MSSLYFQLDEEGEDGTQPGDKRVFKMSPLYFQLDEEGEDDTQPGETTTNAVPILLDLAFANNVRYLGKMDRFICPL
jgi:hypothetical protein